LLYEALSEKKSALPVRILRLFKQEFYDFTLTNTPTANLRVASIDDPRVEDDDLVLAIGKASDFGLKGLRGLSSDEWYRDIVMGNLDFAPDDMLAYAYPSLIAQSNKLPINKYLSKATKKFPVCEVDSKENDFEHIISNSFKRDRHRIEIPSRSVIGIWNHKAISFEKKTRLIAHLEKSEINVSDLECMLRDIFCENPNILVTAQSAEKTNLRRLIRVYDYLKYGNK
jgi:hypothetical protein